MNSLRLLTIWASALACAGCVTATTGTIEATMVPVEGPMSEAKPVPVIPVTVDGVASNTGTLTFTLPGADVCKGRWSSAAGAGITVGSAGLISKYGDAYGIGYSVSTGTGQNPGQALAVCAQGRTVQIEFVTGAGTAHGFGIGKDSGGNVYRFVF